MYGDGCSNQGQIFEAANMCGLWKLPCVFVIENNHYGMSTSEKRSSYYSPIMGKFRGFPAINCDGFNVWAVREACRFAKNFAIENGPIFLEFETYRYQGHSMSDPGLGYRSREEVANVKSTKDGIELVRHFLLDHKFSTEDELKAIEKNIKRSIEGDIEKIKNDPYPDPKELYTNVYVNEKPPFIRGIEYSSSIFNEHKI
jgi:pyruvate dehydrogenase E1 component alpha subunit